MKRKLTALVLGAALATVTAAPALAGPADGRCVSNGVRALDGPTISAVARGALGEGNLVPFVINDHLRNGADVTESILEVEICS